MGEEWGMGVTRARKSLYLREDVVAKVCVPPTLPKTPKHYYCTTLSLRATLFDDFEKETSGDDDISHN